MFKVPCVRVRQSAGFSKLSGTAVIAGTPDAPAARRVQVLTADLIPIHVATTFSDAAAGEWEVEGLADRRALGGYTAIGYDHPGVHDPVAKTRLIPTPMPPDPAEHP